MNELVYAPAATLARRVRDREFSSEDIDEARLRRIEEVNARLNAVVQMAADRALEAAHAAEVALTRTQRVGALHGAAFTVEDRIDAAALPRTGGAPRFRDRRPREDATAAARIPRAGAGLLDRTNAVVENPVYGRTTNPYNLACSPSESSGGEAVLIAAGGRLSAQGRTPAAVSANRPAPAAAYRTPWPLA
jgi:aspartyl-tRNA(Asn)/glutamyl-tRNA(Gln) amidotransferase subunit A